MNYALCLSESGRADDALKALQKALDLATEKNLAIKEQIAVLQTHVSCVLGKPLAKAPPAKAPAKGAPPVEVGIDIEGAMGLIQTTLSTKADVKAVEASLREAWTKVDPKPDEGGREVPMMVVAKVRNLGAESLMLCYKLCLIKLCSVCFVFVGGGS